MLARLAAVLEERRDEGGAEDALALLSALEQVLKDKARDEPGL